MLSEYAMMSDLGGLDGSEGVASRGGQMVSEHAMRVVQCMLSYSREDNPEAFAGPLFCLCRPWRS